MAKEKDTEDIPLIEPSTLETIDYAFYQWVDQSMNIHVDTNKGFKKVPVLWVTAERAYQVKNNKDLRDSEGALIYPLITVERTSIQKDLQRRGRLQSLILPFDKVQGGAYNIHRAIKQDKTREFASTNALSKAKQVNMRGKNGKVVYETLSIPAPVYMLVNYKVTLRSEYQQHMNKMSQPFLVRPGNLNSFFVEHDGHSYEAFYDQNFSYENNISNIGEGERVYITNVDFQVIGYTFTEVDSDNRPKISMYQNPVEIKIGRERAILQEDIDKKL